MSPYPDEPGTPMSAVHADLRRCAAAVAALAGGAVALHQLLIGWHWFALVVGTGLLVAAIGVCGRALGLPAVVVVVAQVLALVVLVTAAFAPGAAVAGFLPGRGALSSLRATLSTGTDAVNHYAPPAPALAGIELLLVLGSGAAAIVLDILLDRGLPALTGLVVLALEAVTVCCLPAGVDTASFLAGGAGWLVVLLAVPARPTRRVADQPPTPPAPTPPAATPPAQGLVGRRTALTSLGLAALVPVVVPGLSSGRISALVAGVGDGVGDGPGQPGGQLLNVRNPFVDLRRNLVQPQDVEVLRYGTGETAGQYLRLATLDLFDGERWTARPHVDRRQIEGGITAAEGLTAAVPRATETISFAMAPGLLTSYLPVPYPATRIDATGGWWFSPAGLDVMSADGQAAGGLRYEVHSLDLSFDPDALRHATPAPTAIRLRDLGLPELPPVVEATMRTVVAGSRTDFDRAVALQEWFRSAFTYDTSIVDTSSAGAIVRFLASRRGYCEQFSATMAAMARLLGIPARVVVGFLPGSRPNEEWIVSAHQAHAWPELYFGGSGWVRFEPTPATQTGSEPDWTLDSSLLGGAGDTSTGAASVAPRIPRAPVAAPSAGAAAGTQAKSAAFGRARLTGIAAGIAGAVVVGVGAPAAVTVVARERRWRAAHRAVATHGAGPAPTAGTTPGITPRTGQPAGSPAARSLATAVHADLADAAWEHLGGWAPATTPRQIGERLRRALRGQPEAAAAASRLVALVEQIRFGAPGAPVSLDPAAIRRDSDLVRHTLALRQPWWRRWRAALLPRELRRRLLSGDRRAAAAAEEAAISAAALTRTAAKSSLAASGRHS